MWQVHLIVLISLLLVALTRGFANEGIGALSSTQHDKIPLAAIRVNGSSDNPGSELFPGKGPYIPSGLSQEEYFKIKKDEAERMKRMEFGAWGPRFKRTETPDGDWMVMPNLWTVGFDAGLRRAGVSNVVDASDQYKNPVMFAAAFLRRKFPELLLSYILLDSLATAVSLYKTVGLTTNNMILIMFRVPSPGGGSLCITSFVKAALVKLVGVALLSPLTTKALETINRRRLWSKKRTIAACTGVSFVFLSLWAFLLRLAAAWR